MLNALQLDSQAKLVKNPAGNATTVNSQLNFYTGHVRLFDF